MTACSIILAAYLSAPPLVQPVRVADVITWTEPRDLPLTDPSKFTALRYPLLELSPHRWVWPLYDRTIVFDEQTGEISSFGDGRDHGMVPIVRTPRGTLIAAQSMN